MVTVGLLRMHWSSCWCFCLGSVAVDVLAQPSVLTRGGLLACLPVSSDLSWPWRAVEAFWGAVFAFELFSCLLLLGLKLLCGWSRQLVCS